jgi:hypothetical protein
MTPPAPGRVVDLITKEEPMMTALVGKYFIGVHASGMRSGIVEAVIDATHYLVRFDDLVGFTDGSKWPPSLAVVPISNMAGSEDEDKPPPWAFFDGPEQRARYDEWFNEPPRDRTPRVVPLKPK